MAQNYKIPTGIFNFSDFNKQQLFFVDKTKLICDTINNTNKMTWYLYPRGFGKTINLNMLYNFFDINHIFISKSFYFVSNEVNIIRLRNQIPVIYLNFTNTESISQKSFFHNFKRVVRQCLNYYPFIFSNENDSFASRAFFQDLYDGYAPDEHYYIAIRKLIAKINRYYNLKVILIIDGYDELFLRSMLCGYYEELYYFFTSFLNETIANNNHIIKVIIGGIFPFKTSFLDDLKIISNINPFSEETPFQFSQIEAMQLIVNVTTEEAVSHLKNSLGFYALNRMTIAPELLVDSLLHVTKRDRIDYLIPLIKRLKNPNINNIIATLLNNKTVPLYDKLRNVYIEEIYENLENNFLLVLLNYGFLGVSSKKKDGSESNVVEVFVANEISRIRLASLWHKVEEENSPIGGVNDGI